MFCLLNRKCVDVSISLLCYGNFKLLKLAFCFGIVNQIIKLKIINKMCKATKSLSIFPFSPYILVSSIWLSWMPNEFFREHQKRQSIYCTLNYILVSSMLQWDRNVRSQEMEVDPKDFALCWLSSRPQFKQDWEMMGFLLGLFPHPSSPFESHWLMDD